METITQNTNSPKEGFFHKLLCLPGGEIGVRETLAYSAGTFGKTMIFSMINIYLMMFYTDVLRVDPKQIAVMFLITKIFDALNDFAMGSLVDRTRTRWGKIRPYLLISAVPLAATTVLAFTAPQLSETGKIAYMYMTYVLWSVAYTMCDVPYSGMAAVITPNDAERTKLVTAVTILGGASNSFPFLLVPFLLSLVRSNNGGGVFKSNESAYFTAALIFAVASAASLLLCFAGTKERVPQSKQMPTLRENFSAVIHNKPLLLVILSVFLSFPRSLQSVAQTYVATYLLGGAEKIILLGAPMVLGTFLGTLCVPAVCRKLGKRKTYILYTLLCAIPFTAEYFIGFNNIFALIVSSFLFTFTMAPMAPIVPLFIADCVDYSEWKTGRRTEGISYSIQTFISKVNSACISFVLGMLLSAFRYVEPQLINGVLVEQVQSASTQQGIWATYTILPALFGLLSVVPILFYPLKENKMTQIRDELTARRNIRSETD